MGLVSSGSVRSGGRGVLFWEVEDDELVEDEDIC